MTLEFMSNIDQKRISELTADYDAQIEIYFQCLNALDSPVVKRTPIKQIRYKQDMQDASRSARAIDGERHMILTKYQYD